MESDTHLPNFITLGQRLWLLKTDSNAQTLIDEIPKFIESLEECGLRRSRTAAEPLNAISSIPRDAYGRTNSVALGQVRAYAETVKHSMYEEAGERTLVAIDVSGVIDALRSLPTNLSLSAAQLRLSDETVTCIERGAYRAAAVMGWNLAYEYIRQWVFDNHLTAFNTSLTTEFTRKNGNPVYTAISDYTDFFAGTPSERTVIDTCSLAGIFGEKIRDNLRFLLRRRNDYAHPTFRTPTREQTNAYVKDLLDIIADPPFTTPPPNSGTGAT